MKALGLTAETLLVSSQEVEGKQDLCFISSKSYDNPTNPSGFGFMCARSQDFLRQSLVF